MKKIGKIIIILSLFFFCPSTEANILDELNNQIQEKQDAIKKMEEQIEVYKKDIEIKQGEAVTLNNQLVILKSKSAKIELDILLTQTQVESIDLEILSLNEIIKEKKEQIIKQKDYLNNLLRLININDQKDYLNIILHNVSFSDFFNQTKYLEDLNSQISRALKILKNEKQELETKEAVAETKRNKLVLLKKELIDHQSSLKRQEEAKLYLLNQTKQSESKFRSLLAQLRQEQTAFDQEIAALQRQIQRELTKDDKLDATASILSWPAEPTKGISAYFRDPNYPFTSILGQHSGIDLPLSVGTPIRASASGYVAWVRSSNKAYGNSIMIIHNEGIATLYAHLSRFNTKEGEFVKRGDIIAYSGGMPGTPGAGFSTGPHLHFEVRVNGLPNNPMNYLR